jgi:hypothetical protein
MGGVALVAAAIAASAIPALGCGLTASTSSQSEPCGVTLAAATTKTAILITAARLTATVTVRDQPTPKPKCVALQSSSPAVTVDMGDKVQFAANTEPVAPIHGTVMPYTRIGSAWDGFEVFNAAGSTGIVVKVSTSPGPKIEPGITPTVATPHVIVTLTTIHPGTVEVSWFDCFDTQC